MKHNLKLGIRAKLVTLTASVLTIIFTGIGLYLARVNTSTLRTSLYEEATSFATLATEPIGSVFVLYNDSGTINVDREIEDFAKLNKNITNIEVIDSTGKILYSQHKDKEFSVTIVQAESYDPIYLYNSDNVVETIIYPYKENNGVRRYSIVYTVSSSSINNAVNAASRSVLLLSLAGLLTTTVLVYFFINRWLIRKIRTISRQSIMISNGQLDQNILVESNDELGELANSVNNMADSLKTDILKLKELDKAKTEFMMITSHNLRTPLTIINGYLETMELYNTVDDLKFALKEIAAGSKRLSIFAEDILTISRLEMGENLGAVEPIEISGFLSTVAQDFSSLTTMKKVTFTSTLPEITRKVSINKMYMRAALWNILDNALKFTDTGGKIELAATALANRVEISISDNGIGISAEEINKLFTKFHRGTSTLTYNYEGTGIGLYATKMIIDRLDGKISVNSTLGKGSTFTIYLPYETLPASVTQNPEIDAKTA